MYIYFMNVLCLATDWILELQNARLIVPFFFFLIIFILWTLDLMLVRKISVSIDFASFVSLEKNWI